MQKNNAVPSFVVTRVKKPPKVLEDKENSSPMNIEEANEPPQCMVENPDQGGRRKKKRVLNPLRELRPRKRLLMCDALKKNGDDISVNDFIVRHPELEDKQKVGS